MPNKRKHYKRCNYCNRPVHPNTGTYYHGKLVHERCLILKKINE